MKKHSISLLVLFFLSPIYAIFDGQGVVTPEATYLLQLADLGDKSCYEYGSDDQENDLFLANAKGSLLVDVYHLNLVSFNFQQKLKGLPFLACSPFDIAQRVFLIEHHRQSNYLSLLQQLPQAILHLLYDTFLI